MTMTNEEIVRHYRQAKKKIADLRILADLNCTSVAEICKILEAEGVKLAGLVKRAAKETPETTAQNAAKPPAAAPGIYDQLEAILAALPPELSAQERTAANTLLLAMFAGYLKQRLGGAQDE